jgi:PA14 domain/Bacterial Ig domain
VLAQWIAALAPNTPPVVAITSPANNTSFLQGTPIPLTATASDTDGIQRVEFYDGLYKIGEATGAPYSFVWNGASRATHQVSAIAIDSVGNSAQSAVVNVLVQGAPLPSPWLHEDIGNVGLIGDASYGAGTFTLTGSGGDIWGGADAFHFVHRTMSGDGEIVARVVSLQDTDGWAKAGVMMRETLAPGSRYSFSMMSYGNGAGHQFRKQTDAGAEHVGGPGVAAPYWVRLVRSGDVFRAYASPDGVDWTLMDEQTIAMSGAIQVGLAVTSHNNGASNEAVFANVSGLFGEPTWTAKINFQLAGAPIPAGYLPDTGAPFAAASGGLSYGWSRDNTADARDRDSAFALDQRYDTLVHFQKDHGGGSVSSSWEISVPNATYEVRLVAGDPENWGDTQHITIEGQTFLDETTADTTRLLEATGSVVVADGRLTIAPGANAVNAKICFVEIVSYDAGVNQLPAVALTAPASASRFVNATSIPIAATASDPDGAIASVEFLVDGVKVGEDASAPFGWTWTPPVYGTHVLAARAIDNVGGSTTSAPVSVTVENAGVAGFRGEYFDNADFTNLVLVRADAAIDFAWGGGSPDARVGVEGFAVRWSGRIRPRYTETYNFATVTDDGVRLWVNGQLLIDQWVDQSSIRHAAMLSLVADQEYEVVMEYFENGGDAVARLFWSSNSQPEEPIPAIRTTVPVPPDSLAAWRRQHFGTLANTGNAADLADPDGDGIANVLEAVLGSNPNVASPGALPLPTVAPDGALTLDYRVSRSVLDLAVMPEISSNLVDWFSGSTFLEDTQTGADASFTYRRARVLGAPLIPPGDETRFIRLRVAQ